MPDEIKLPSETPNDITVIHISFNLSDNPHADLKQEYDRIFFTLHIYKDKMTMRALARRIKIFERS